MNFGKSNCPFFCCKVAIISLVISLVSVLILSVLPVWVLLGVEAIYTISLLFLVPSFDIVKVVLCSHFLGSAFAVGAITATMGEGYFSFGCYAMALAFFHFSEYVVTAIFTPHSLTIDSFLLNHSMEYGVAAMLSWIEFLLEFYFFPAMKSQDYIILLGAVMVIGGDGLRKVSMITAGTNFTHMVQYRKRASHQLVTHGVYSLFRHPAYVGWLYWSIGTQILLCNPVCLMGYSVASWMFFHDRIYDEEQNLILFFGGDYIEYKRKVRTGLPFNPGYPMDKALQLVKYSMHK